VLNALRTSSQGGHLTDVTTERFSALREILGNVSRSRALQSYSPSETASFVLSLKEPIFERLGKSISDPAILRSEVWTLTQLIDQLALYTTDVFQQWREEVIKRQQEELAELSTPVVRLWKGVLALPLIGTLDSERTQKLMERLLERIVETNSAVALLDVTGVPTIDTRTAQNLAETTSAVRLLGAQAVLTGVRPAIAQTLAQLGVDLGDITTRSSLAAGLRVALKLQSLQVVSSDGTR